MAEYFFDILGNELSFKTYKVQIPVFYVAYGSLYNGSGVIILLEQFKIYKDIANWKCYGPENLWTHVDDIIVDFFDQK